MAFDDVDEYSYENGKEHKKCKIKFYKQEYVHTAQQPTHFI